MGKLLYIQASPRERSKSTQVAKAFLDRYQQAHPTDAIAMINIFEKNLPAFDGLTVQAKYTIMHGKDHTSEEQQAWKAVEEVIAEFKDADKYLFSLPMWNFGIPYRLKQYLDIVIQPGYTFTADDSGYHGLMQDKPAAVIYARGGAYPAGSDTEAYDMQKKYFDLALGFIGFAEIQSIVIEPTMHAASEEVENIVQASIAQAVEIARVF